MGMVKRILWVFGIRKCPRCKSKMLMTTLADIVITWRIPKSRYDGNRLGQVHFACPKCKFFELK